MTPDNNLGENAIRPFVAGRKNWLFAGTPDGAKATADLYSLIETAKANSLEPCKYLRYLFEKISIVESENDFKALLFPETPSASIFLQECCFLYQRAVLTKI